LGNDAKKIQAAPFKFFALAEDRPVRKRISDLRTFKPIAYRTTFLPMTTIEFWTALSAICALAYCLITAVTLIFLGVQLREARRYTLAQFVYQLGKEFEAFDEALQPLLLKDSDRKGLEQQLLRCLQFFERTKTLCDIGVLDVKILDAMFGYQFFYLVNDPWVQKSLLLCDPHYFPEVFALHKQLSDCHRRLGLEIPGAQNDLALENPTRYEKNIEYYRAKRVRRTV
jgi:hypothetical protein